MSENSQKKVAGQNASYILKSIENIFEQEGKHAALNMKNHLAISFFKMIINEDNVDDYLRNMARSYLNLFQFLSNFDELLIGEG